MHYVNGCMTWYRLMSVDSVLRYPIRLWERLHVVTSGSSLRESTIVIVEIINSLSEAFMLHWN